MEPSRVERYLDKLDHARERLGFVEAWSRRAPSEAHWRLATYKAFQEAAEHDVIDPDHVDVLAEATGLRNRLVHEYETLDDDIALDSIEERLQPMQSGLEEVERWLDSQR